MKKIILAIFLFVCGYYYIQNKIFVEVEYFYDGPYTRLVDKGIKKWENNKLKFIKVNSEEDAYLIIKHVDPYLIKGETWSAQYVSRTKTIMLNNKYDYLFKKGYIVSLRRGQNTLRIDPPLIIDEAILGSFVEELKDVFKGA